MEASPTKEKFWGIVLIGTLRYHFSIPFWNRNKIGIQFNFLKKTNDAAQNVSKLSKLAKVTKQLHSREHAPRGLEG